MGWVEEPTPVSCRGAARAEARVATRITPGLRAPLSDDHDAAGETYYGPDHLAVIDRSFEAKPNADLAEFRRKIERQAWLYVAYEHGKTRRPLPSDRKRHIAKLRKRAAAFAEALDSARSSIWLAEDIRGAAEKLARRKEALPSYPPDLIEYESCPPGDPVILQSWGRPAEEQIKTVYDELQWFLEVLRLAEMRAQQAIRPASPRADEPLHEFICGIERLYEQTASNPTRPYFDPTEDVQRGELLDLINACLTPLGVNLTRSALLALYRRATE
jgi:hypothetical protein